MLIQELQAENNELKQRDQDFFKLMEDIKKMEAECAQLSENKREIEDDARMNSDNDFSHIQKLRDQ